MTGPGDGDTASLLPPDDDIEERRKNMILIEEIPAQAVEVQQMEHTRTKLLRREEASGMRLTYLQQAVGCDKRQRRQLRLGNRQHPTLGPDGEEKAALIIGIAGCKGIGTQTAQLTIGSESDTALYHTN